MGVFHERKSSLRAARRAIVRLLTPGVLYLAVYSARADGPVLSLPVLQTNLPVAQLAVTNSSDTNSLYVVQMSTNLQDWTSLMTNLPDANGFSAVVPATNPVCFYRAITIPSVLIPYFWTSVVTIGQFDLNGNGSSIDSFDSSDPNYSTNGQYTVSLRKAGGGIASESTVTNSRNIGNCNVFGYVYTGPGTTAQTAVDVGTQGAVGDLEWQAIGHGIEPGHWIGNFYFNFPDVTTPTFVGSALPAATNGFITLNGGAYTTATSPSSPLVVTAPTVLWVQNSFSSGVTVSNSGSLILFVGTTNASGNNSVSIGGNGSMNQPGYAKNLQIYGLPSVTSISFAGNAAFAGTIYAPEADVTGGGAGNNTLDIFGAMVVKSMTLNGHWNFHFDENLRVAGPALNGPALNGPALNGPALNGPAF